MIKTKNEIDSVGNKDIVKTLSKKQKELIKLLQNKETLIENEKAISITCGRTIKKIPILTFYSLINKGLIYRQIEWPFNYLLSPAGETIVI